MGFGRSIGQPPWPIGEIDTVRCNGRMRDLLPVPRSFLRLRANVSSEAVCVPLASPAEDGRTPGVRSAVGLERHCRPGLVVSFSFFFFLLDSWVIPHIHHHTRPNHTKGSLSVTTIRFHPTSRSDGASIGGDTKPRVEAGEDTNASNRPSADHPREVRPLHIGKRRKTTPSVPGKVETQPHSGAVETNNAAIHPQRYEHQSHRRNRLADNQDLCDDREEAKTTQRTSSWSFKDSKFQHQDRSYGTGKKSGPPEKKQLHH